MHLHTIIELKEYSSSIMRQWYNTTRYMNLLCPIAEDREQWKLLILELNKQPALAMLLRTCSSIGEVHIPCEKCIYIYTHLPMVEDIAIHKSVGLDYMQPSQLRNNIY